MSSAGSSSSGGGGGAADVGTVTATMSIRNFDETNRPFRREDLSEYILNNYYTMPPEEKTVVDRAVFSLLGGLPLSFATGFWFSGRFLNWKQITKSIGFRWVKGFGRTCFGVGFMAIPFAVVQQRFIAQVNDLPMTFPLSFHVRRMLITQRGAVMFGRSNLREVTVEEQRAFEKAAVQVKQENTRMLTGSAVDVNAELQKQVMLPVAQTGYKSM